ncbi:hypothetical protein VKT23_020798 [Stygiomarasmius scandens]|uniref:Uncharacterized protein n=1 Tax=Marasmiellus scandens TaxID=2682957 RepID=A0ABR1IQV6_9AGAR
MIKFNLLSYPFLLAFSATNNAVMGTILKSPPVISAFNPCGGEIEGVCAEGTKCSGDLPNLCLPLDSFVNNTASFSEVKGFGRPVGTIEDTTNACDNPIPVFTMCTDAQFTGSCETVSTCCDFCFGLGNGFVNDVSSIRILSSQVGCNFWVSSNCVGDGIKIDSGAIFDLSATNYNDRVVAVNCYLR